MLLKKMCINTWFKLVVNILGSIVVSIPACHAGDRGSIPRRGERLSSFFFFFFSFFFSLYLVEETFKSCKIVLKLLLYPLDFFRNLIRA